MTSEDAIDAAMSHGYRPHDARAFGTVIRGLARRELIRCCGYADRRKGHGTSGARVWEAVI
jgi:hypothetical protein